MKDQVPDFRFLAHVVDVVPSMHVPFVFRSCSSLPFATRLALLPLWPVIFAFMLIQWFCSKTFSVSFYFLRGFHVRAAREASGRGSSGSTLGRRSSCSAPRTGERSKGQERADWMDLIESIRMD
ncbi:gl1 protein [Panicum miliaceum]|uniref:Gl1 protein n=1 Tax=Panicum miliaceum TaxID=4540 RepID=A0A3L6SQX4_PANMI|nr:gl1 protein [Panicum miliaceum]